MIAGAMGTAERIDDRWPTSEGAPAESLEELSGLLRSLRARAGLAKQAERASLLGVIEEIESRYKLRRAELA